MSTKNRTVALELGTSNSDIYTVPNNYETQVKSIFISNLTGNQVTFSLDWYDSSTTTYYTITEATKLLPNAIIQITESLWLEEADKIRGLASATSSVNISINVEEAYIPRQI